MNLSHFLCWSDLFRCFIGRKLPYQIDTIRLHQVISRFISLFATLIKLSNVSKVLSIWWHYQNMNLCQPISLTSKRPILDPHIYSGLQCPFLFITKPETLYFSFDIFGNMKVRFSDRNKSYCVYLDIWRQKIKKLNKEIFTIL